MRYVYLLKSIPFPDETYVGMTSDLKTRLHAHNAGESIHTSKYHPWVLIAYVAFTDEHRDIELERYLKSGSGRVFANKHLW
jgi:putative endonuclease